MSFPVRGHCIWNQGYCLFQRHVRKQTRPPSHIQRVELKLSVTKEFQIALRGKGLCSNSLRLRRGSLYMNCSSRVSRAAEFTEWLKGQVLTSCIRQWLQKQPRAQGHWNSLKKNKNEQRTPRLRAFNWTSEGVGIMERYGLHGEKGKSHWVSINSHYFWLK